MYRVNRIRCGRMILRYLVWVIRRMELLLIEEDYYRRGWLGGNWKLDLGYVSFEMVIRYLIDSY